jgi:GDP-mannose 4,6-dehydratase
VLSKGYEVHGIIRRASTFNTHRIEHIYQDVHEPQTRLFLHYGDLINSEQITNLIYNVQPDEMYHLGAQSHVKVSFDTPEYTGDITMVNADLERVGLASPGEGRRILHNKFDAWHRWHDAVKLSLHSMDAA